MNRNLVSFIVAISISIIVTFWLTALATRFQGFPFDSDEGLHAIRGVELVMDLNLGDWEAFWDHSHKQNEYPPFFPWLMTLIYQFVLPSNLSARLISVFSFSLSIITIYWIGRHIHDEYGWFIGTGSALLMALSQSLLIDSSLVMLEAIGLLSSLVTLLLYILATKSTRAKYVFYMLVGLFASITMLIKYPYGLVIIISLFLSEVAIRLMVNKSNIDSKTPISHSFLWLIPCLIILGWWFSFDGKIAGFYRYANAQPLYTELWSLNNWLYYPIAISQKFTPSYSISLILLLAIIWSIAKMLNSILVQNAHFSFSETGYVVLLSYFLCGLLIMTLKASNNPRFIYIVAPASFPLTMSFIIWLWEKRKKSKNYLEQIPFFLIILLIIFSTPKAVQRIAIVPQLLAIAYETDEGTEKMYSWIKQVTNGERIYVVNPWDQVNIYAMEWYYAKNLTGEQTSFGEVKIPHERLRGYSEEQVNFMENQMVFYEVPYIVVFQGGLEGSQDWELYVHHYDDWLITPPLESRTFSVDFSLIGSWIQVNEVTKNSLVGALNERQLPLNVTVSIYEKLEGEIKN